MQASVCLADAQWPLLENLGICKTGFDGSVAPKLFDGKWPCLLLLDISRNDFTWKSAELSEEPAWPLMKHLKVSGCGLVPAPGQLLHVTKVKWSQLQSVDLQENRLRIEGVRALVQAAWHNVTAINLDGCSRLTDEHFACLCTCTWPLKSLSLCRTCLSTSALAHLSNGDWPNLKKLDLCHSEHPLPVAAVVELVKGRWPLLEWLCLCGNFCDAYVVRELIQADWPLLKTLQLACNAFPPESAADVIRGNWPLL